MHHRRQPIVRIMITICLYITSFYMAYPTYLKIASTAANSFLDSVPLPFDVLLTRSNDHKPWPLVPLISAETARPLVARSPYFQSFVTLHNGWNLYHSSWNSIALPVQPAAWAFSRLYSGILGKAQGSWAARPLQHYLRVDYGEVYVRMFCEDEPIPWEFVAEFAAALLRITGNGWTGSYTLMLSHAEMGLTVFNELGFLSRPSSLLPFL